MKCPLQKNYRLDQGFYNVVGMGDCLKEECAWWDHQLKVCSLKVVRESLLAISQTLASMHDKMPSEKQFRR